MVLVSGSTADWTRIKRIQRRKMITTISKKYTRIAQKGIGLLSLSNGRVPHRSIVSAFGMGHPKKIGPIPCTEKGLAAEQEGKRKTWRDEPVPSNVLPCNEEFPGVPDLSSRRTSAPPNTEITVLPNGFKVITQETNELISTMGVFIDAGSKYELDGDRGQPSELGACNFLEYSILAATKNMSPEDIANMSLKYGINASCLFSREVFSVRMTSLRENSQHAMNYLGDVINQPVFSEDVVNATKQAITFQRNDTLSQPSLLCTENLMLAAYGEKSPYGRYERCPIDRIDSMTPEILQSYTSKHFRSNRMLFVGLSVDHDKAVEIAKSQFGNMPPVTPEEIRTNPSYSCDPPVYTGGDIRSTPDWSTLQPSEFSANAKTEFTHMSLAFPTEGWKSDDIWPICVADTLLGGGSSFSAGGPGKGMYSRIFLEVLNLYAFTESCNAFSDFHYDCGLVGIYGAAMPDYAGDLASIMATTLVELCNRPITEVELNRAKNQLASSLMMNLETRSLLLDDTGRQHLHHGKRLDPAEGLRRIRAVTSDDIVRVIRKALAHPPSFSAVGAVSTIPSYEAFRNYFEREAEQYRLSYGSAFLQTEKKSAA